MALYKCVYYYYYYNYVDGAGRALRAARLLAAAPCAFCVTVRRHSLSRMRSSTSSSVLSAGPPPARPPAWRRTVGELAPLRGVSDAGTLEGRSRAGPASAAAVDRGTNRRVVELLRAHAYITIKSKTDAGIARSAMLHKQVSKQLCHLLNMPTCSL